MFAWLLLVGSNELWQSARWRCDCRHSVSLRLKAMKPEPLFLTLKHVHTSSSFVILGVGNTVQVWPYLIRYTAHHIVKRDLGTGDILWFNTGERREPLKTKKQIFHIYLTEWSEREPQIRDPKKKLHRVISDYKWAGRDADSGMPLYRLSTKVHKQLIDWECARERRGGLCAALSSSHVWQG